MRKIFALCFLGILFLLFPTQTVKASEQASIDITKGSVEIIEDGYIQNGKTIVTNTNKYVVTGTYDGSGNVIESDANVALDILHLKRFLLFLLIVLII